MQEAQNQQRCVRVPGINSPRDYIYKLGYHIEEEETELMPGFLYMGIMEPDRQTIRLNLRVINLAEAYMEKSLHLSREAEQVKKFRDIILFHELYHVIEEKTPEFIPEMFESVIGLRYTWMEPKIGKCQ